MPVHSELGKRMKLYEIASRTHLMRRAPVIIRLDGKAFHSFTRGFKKPFDDVLITAMERTMQYLCENIQGCVLGYTQSDEITLVLVDYQKLNSAAWFDNQTQKMCSVAASMATVAFNKFFKEGVEIEMINYLTGLAPQDEDTKERIKKYHKTLTRATEKGAMFDARVFNIPREEVTNNILWRQLDATRNSIQMMGQTYFSHSQLQGKTCKQIQEMLFQEEGINWDKLPTKKKRGSCCVKREIESNGQIRHQWQIDEEIPIFKGEGRKYIDSLVGV